MLQTFDAMLDFTHQYASARGWRCRRIYLCPNEWYRVIRTVAGRDLLCSGEVGAPVLCDGARVVIRAFRPEVLAAIRAWDLAP